MQKLADDGRLVRLDAIEGRAAFWGTWFRPDGRWIQVLDGTDPIVAWMRHRNILRLVYRAASL